MLALILTLSLVQDDPWETHLYNVEFLTRVVDDRPGVDLGLGQDAIGVAVAASEMAKAILTGEDLVNLIKNNIAEDTWEHVQAHVTYNDGIITVTNKKSVHDRIKQYLAYWRSFFGKMIAVDALLLSVDPKLLATTRAAGNLDRPMVLPPEHLKVLLDAAREGKTAELLKSLRVTAHPGQRVNLTDAARHQYVRDHDIQIATASVALDPIIDEFTSGVAVDVTPYLEPFLGAVTLEIRAGRVEPEGVAERKLKLAREVRVAGVGSVQVEDKSGTSTEPRAGGSVASADVKIELPKVAIDRLRTTLTAKGRETVIAASTFRGGRQVLFLLTPSVVAIDDRPVPEPAFEEQRVMKLYDISPLTRRVQDWAGPKLGIPTAGFGGGGPLAGATFTLDEPKARMEADSVLDLLRTRVAPDTWGNKRNSLTAGPEGTLLARQKPEVLKEIDRLLGQLLHVRAQMISTEAVLISFRKTGRADWEKEIPALLPGGYFVERAAFDKLMEEAYKGQNVRLVEISEISSFPQQRVHAARLQVENLLVDYEPQVATCAWAYDPIIGTASAGFVLDVRPHFIDDSDRIAVSLRASLARHDVREVETSGPASGPLQIARGQALRWESDVLCAKDRWTLVGLQSRGRGEDAEDLALFLRARPNVLR
ncbi:MAG TPA: hypothetical protein VF950_04990 [Planctomycetota bacterium]